MSEPASVITAIATLITAVTALASVLINSRRLKHLSSDVEDVHTEVKTGNSQTMAQLADAQEGRRIDNIPVKDRTALEKSHLRET